MPDLLRHHCRQYLHRLGYRPHVGPHPFLLGSEQTTRLTPARPIPLLWNVQLNTNAKLSVGAILGLGIL